MHSYFPLFSILFLFLSCNNTDSTATKESLVLDKASATGKQITPVSIEKLLQQKLPLPFSIKSPKDSTLQVKYQFEQLPIWLQQSVFWPKERLTAEGFYFDPSKEDKKGGIRPSFIGSFSHKNIASMLFHYRKDVMTMAGRYSYEVYEIRNYNLETKTLIDSLPAAKYIFLKDGALTETTNSSIQIKADLSMIIYSQFEDYDEEPIAEGREPIHNIYTDTIYYKMLADGRFKKGR